MWHAASGTFGGMPCKYSSRGTWHGQVKPIPVWMDAWDVVFAIAAVATALTTRQAQASLEEC